MTSLARVTDPVTSHEAAVAIQGRAVTDRQVVLSVLRTYGAMTDEVLEGFLIGISPSSGRTRRAELVRKGLVRDSGQRRLTRSGRRAIVWEAA